MWLFVMICQVNDAHFSKSKFEQTYLQVRLNVFVQQKKSILEKD